MKPVKNVTGHFRSDLSNSENSDTYATAKDLVAAHNLEPKPSRDWTKLSNILRRAGGAFSHARKT